MISRRTIERCRIGIAIACGMAPAAGRRASISVEQEGDRAMEKAA
jgi:hypothetical protein